MLGWMIVFALMSIFAAILMMAEDPAGGFISMKLATLVFGVLFLACLLTTVARRRA